MADKKFNKLSAINNYVALRIEKIAEKTEDWKTTKDGLLLPKQVSSAQPQNEKYRVNLYIHSIGDGVENPSFKVGDKVVANDYDMQFVTDSDDADEETIYALVQASQIKAVLS